MMTNHVWCRAGQAALVLCTVAAALLGCHRPTSTVELVSYKDPYFPEPYQVDFDHCVYRVDRGGDHHLVGRADFQPSADGQGRVTQFLHVHMFWKPWPGKTYADSTGMDATLRYVIVTQSGVASYVGTGFVYPKRQRRNGTIVAKIEHARLRLETLVGAPPELLGDARLNGTLVATHQPNQALDTLREMELHAAGQGAAP